MERDDGAGSGRDEANPSAADSFVRISELRTSIAEVLSRIDEIRQQEIPQIKADYATKIGVWNARLLKAELAARRAKRRHAMARASVNRGERVDAANITKQLDAELRESKPGHQGDAPAQRIAALEQRYDDDGPGRGAATEPVISQTRPKIPPGLVPRGQGARAVLRDSLQRLVER